MSQHQNDNFSLINNLKGTISKVQSIRDQIGFRRATVWVCEIGGNKDTEFFRWHRMQPTPKILFTRSKIIQKDGGVIWQPSVLLQSIPIDQYGENDLDTSVLGMAISAKYFVLKQGAYYVAFTTKKITRRALVWDVEIIRYSSINENELQPPSPKS